MPAPSQNPRMRGFSGDKYFKLRNDSAGARRCRPLLSVQVTPAGSTTIALPASTPGAFSVSASSTSASRRAAFIRFRSCCGGGRDTEVTVVQPLNRRSPAEYHRNARTIVVRMRTRLANATAGHTVVQHEHRRRGQVSAATGEPVMTSPVSGAVQRAVRAGLAGCNPARAQNRDFHDGRAPIPPFAAFWLAPSMLFPGSRRSCR
jgi:hypothetical protein